MQGAIEPVAPIIFLPEVGGDECNLLQYKAKDTTRFGGFALQYALQVIQCLAWLATVHPAACFDKHGVRQGTWIGGPSGWLGVLARAHGDGCIASFTRCKRIRR